MEHEPLPDRRVILDVDAAGDLVWNRGMGDGGMGWWATNMALALAVIGDRTLRRRAILRFLLLLLGMFALGLWGIDGWLVGSPWRFLIYWGACGALTVFVMLFAIYDALAVVREERLQYMKEMKALRDEFPESEDSACDGEE